MLSEDSVNAIIHIQQYKAQEIYAINKTVTAYTTGSNFYNVELVSSG